MTTSIFWLTAAFVGVYLLHLAAIRMEKRGWIYYRRRGGGSSTIGNAFMEVQSLLEPSKSHVVHIARAEAVEEDHKEDPPPPLEDFRNER